MATKQERAVAIYKANHQKMSNKDIVKKLMKELHMSEAGARTYAYNAKKALGVTKPAKGKVVTKAKVKATVDKKTGKLTVTKTAGTKNVPVLKGANVTERRKENEKLFNEFNAEKVAAL